MNDQRLDALLRMIEETTVSGRRISMDDEIYYDLRISGDDLYDLLTRAAEQFGTDFSNLDLQRYAPGEGAAILKPALASVGLRPYESLKVRDIWDAVVRGMWKSDAHQK